MVFDELPPDILVGLGGTEEHPVRHDAGAPPTHLQHLQKEGQEQQLGLFGLAELEKVGGDNLRVQAALEGGIGQDEGVPPTVQVLVGEAVPVLDDRVFDSVGHHVHGADAQHGAVHIEAVEHPVHIVVLFLPVKENLLLPPLPEVLPRRHQKPGGSAGRVADDLIGPRVHQLHHHADDVPRRAELPIHPGGSDLGEEKLVDIPPHIPVMELCHLLIDAVQGGDDLLQHQRGGNLEDGVSHILGVGAGSVAVQVFDEGEHPLLHDHIHLPGRKIPEHRPF